MPGLNIEFHLDSKSHLGFLVRRFQLDCKFCLRHLLHMCQQDNMPVLDSKLHQDSMFVLDSRSQKKSFLESKDHMSHLSVGVSS